jgi:hypothetical protein
MSHYLITDKSFSANKKRPLSPSISLIREGESMAKNSNRISPGHYTYKASQRMTNSPNPVLSKTFEEYPSAENVSSYNRHYNPTDLTKTLESKSNFLEKIKNSYHSKRNHSNIFTGQMYPPTNNIYSTTNNELMDSGERPKSRPKSKIIFRQPTPNLSQGLAQSAHKSQNITSTYGLFQILAMG